MWDLGSNPGVMNNFCLYLWHGFYRFLTHPFSPSALQEPENFGKSPCLLAPNWWELLFVFADRSWTENNEIPTINRTKSGRDAHDPWNRFINFTIETKDGCVLHCLAFVAVCVCAVSVVDWWQLFASRSDKSPPRSGNRLCWFLLLDNPIRQSENKKSKKCTSYRYATKLESAIKSVSVPRSSHVTVSASRPSGLTRWLSRCPERSLWKIHSAPNMSTYLSKFFTLAPITYLVSTITPPFSLGQIPCA